MSLSISSPLEYRKGMHDESEECKGFASQAHPYISGVQLIADNGSIQMVYALLGEAFCAHIYATQVSSVV